MRKYGWTGPGPSNWTRPTYSLMHASLPDHVDRLSMGIAIRDQGQEGCCTGFGTSRAIQTATGSAILSPQFPYFNAEVIEGTETTDSGAIIADVFDGITEYGICTEAVYPYEAGGYANRPSLDAYADAKINTPRFTTAVVQNLAQIKDALAHGHPVVFGFSVPQSFESYTDGVYRPPLANDPFIGGHCVVADGYDHREGFIWCANSWGKDFGYNGWFKLSESWFTDPRRLWDDAHAVIGG